MTEKQANEFLHTKYPEGCIVRKNASSAGHKYFVTFQPEGKAYYYNAQNYSILLARLGIKGFEKYIY